MMGMTLWTPTYPKRKLSDIIDKAHFEKRQLARDEFDGTEDHAWLVLLEDGSQISVLDRMTGFGWRDIETGYRNHENAFWLASGQFDARDHIGRTYGEFIEILKNRAQIKEYKHTPLPVIAAGHPEEG